MWSTIHEINLQLSSHWIVGGEFNSLPIVFERLSSYVVQVAEVDEFMDCTIDYCLQETGNQGPTFSWSNKQV